MRIIIASSIDPTTIRHLQERHDVVCATDGSRERLLELIKDREALVFRSGVNVDLELLMRAPDLRLIVRAGCGLDNLDLDYVSKHNIVLERISEPAAIAVAELTFALMTGVARRVREADALLRQGRWAKKEMTGHLLWGKTLGIIGAGNIGGRVGQLGSAYGMRVLGCVEHPDEAEARLMSRGIELATFQQVLAESDFITIHVPLKESTHNLVDARAISAMKPGSFLLNMARGGVVDENALYDALASGKIKGAALDVHQNEGEGKISPLASLPNVLLTPHIGSSTFETQLDIGRRLIELINKFAAISTPLAAVAD